MNHLKTLVGIVALFCLNACGLASSENNQLTQNSGTPQSAEAMYNSLPTSGNDSVSLSTNFNSITFQRSTSTLICRKSAATVPNPVFNYQCWRSFSTGSAAQQLFNSYIASQYGVNMNYAGSSIQEVQVPITRDICQKTTVLYPGAPSQYTCFQLIAF